MSKEKQRYSLEDFYNNYLSSFSQGLKLIFGIPQEKHINIIEAKFNPKTNKFIMEIEYSDIPLEHKLETKRFIEH